jgi:formyl-CoA transferase
VVLNAPGDHHFHAILEVMGRGELRDDPRFMSRTARVQNVEAVDALIEGWSRQHARDDVARRMLAAKVPCAPVRELSEVMVDENMHARGQLQWVEHPDLGRVVLMHSPLVFEGSVRRPIVPSLPMGASNEAIYGAWLGHSAQELAALRLQDVIS